MKILSIFTFHSSFYFSGLFYDETIAADDDEDVDGT